MKLTSALLAGLDSKMCFRLVLVTGVLLGMQCHHNSDPALHAPSNRITSERLINLTTHQKLRFIQNAGQVDAGSRFHVEAAEHNILFYPNKVLFQKGNRAHLSHQVSLQFVGADSDPAIEGLGRQASVANFYTGSNPEHWQTNVPTFDTVRYHALYPGIDMGYLGNAGVLESEFYVSPNVDYRQIKLRYDGVRSIEINEDGSLVLTTELGQLVERTPYVFQDIEGERHDIKAEYVLLSDATVGFELDSYDADYAVVIDPEIVFFATIEGAAIGGEFASGAVLDSHGDVIVAGAANRFFPAIDTIEGSNHESGLSNDCLLLKLDGASGAVIYSALFGGTQNDFFYDIAIDAFDNLLLAGITRSEDFPIRNAFQDTLGGEDDAFIVRVDASGALVSSTYFGGSGRDWARGVDTDTMGHIFVAGRTTSTDMPVQGAFQGQNRGGINGFDDFIAKFNPSIDSLVYATYLGGSGDERYGGFGVTPGGEAVLAGNTSSTDFPVRNAVQDTFGGGNIGFGEGDIFVTKLNATGDELVYSTYFGGAADDRSAGLAFTVNDGVGIAGATNSLDFPVINGESFPEMDSTDGVLISLDQSGQVIYSLRSNLPNNDEFRGVAHDLNDRTLVVGGPANQTTLFEAVESGSTREHNGFIFKPLLTWEATGHVINAVNYVAGGGTPNSLEQLLLAMSFIDPFMPSGSRASVASISLGDLFEIELDSSCLQITFRGPNNVGLKVSCDEFGFLTINGVASSTILAADVAKIFVTGSEGADMIDLYDFNETKFPKSTSEIYPAQVRAGDGNDDITGSKDKQNLIFGEGGDDLASGGSGHDVMEGGTGDDEMSGGDGNDEMYGGEGDDALYGDDGKDEMWGDAGDDTMSGGDEEDDMSGGDGDDIMDGGGEEDNMQGGDGDDVMNGGDDDDTMLGGNGDDLMDGDNGDDFYDGGFGFDVSIVKKGDTEALPGSGNDLVLFAYLIGDVAHITNAAMKEQSHSGNATSISNSLLVNDTGGIDTLDFSPTDFAVTLDISLTGTEQVIDTAGSAILLEGNFEVVIGSEHDDEITVTPLMDTIRHLDGGDGFDVLHFQVSEAQPEDDGMTIRTPGYADVTYVNFEIVNLEITSATTDLVSIPVVHWSPNPFETTTMFRFTLSQRSSTYLTIYDHAGRVIRTLVNQTCHPGVQIVEWDGTTDIGQRALDGIYFSELVVNGRRIISKVVLY